MAEIIIMPKLGFNMDEGQLVKWHRRVGETVKKGEVLFEINTDKTTMPVEATADGTVLQLMLEEGAFAEVFTPIAVIGAPGEDPNAVLNGPATPQAAPAAPAEPAGYDYDVVVIGAGPGGYETAIKAAQCGKKTCIIEGAGFGGTCLNVGCIPTKALIQTADAGPGGYETAIKAAQCGKKTCIIEGAGFGGTCLNVGCIPTKALIQTADVYHKVKDAARFAVTGVEADKIAVDMAALQARKKAVVKTLVNGVKGLLRGNKVTVVEGMASFADTHTLSVDGRSITGANIIIATGSSVFMPPFIALEGENHLLTSTEALDLDQVPASVTVIGGGVIGVEFAYLLNRLGSKVTVLELMELMDHILPMVDIEVSRLAEKRMTKDGILFRLGAKVSRVKDDTVYYEFEGQNCQVKSDMVLMAVGRVPNTQGLNAEGIGIEFDRKAIRTDAHMRTNIPHIYAIGDVNGKVMLRVPNTQGLNAEGIGIEFDRKAIRTDAHMRTNIPHIYAIGDVNGKVMLAHTASHEGMVAVADICGQGEEMRYDRIPSCVYLEPEIACIGLTEAQAREKYGDGLKIGRFNMAANGKSLIAGDTDGLFKVIVAADTGEILGAHLYGQHVTDMIGEISAAMAAEGTAEELIHAIHPHPTVNEALGEAFMAAWNGRAINSL